jgi:hypothetical protein
MRNVPRSSRSTVHGSHLPKVPLGEEAANAARARRAARIRGDTSAMEAPSTTHVVMTQFTTRIRMIRTGKGACVCQRSWCQCRMGRADLRREADREIAEALSERKS